mgnify:CR=1 FL=1
MNHALSILSVAVLLAVAVGCRPGKVAGFDSPQPAARVDAILDAARSGDRSAIPDLIVMLDSDDPRTRLLASQTLEDMTGQTLGYEQNAPEFERSEAVGRWVRWYEAESAA